MANSFRKYFKVRKRIKDRKKEINEDIKNNFNNCKEKKTCNANFDYSKAFEELDRLNRIQALHSPFREGFRPFIPLLVAISILILLWLFHKPSVDILLSAEVSKVAMALDINRSPAIEGIDNLEELKVQGLDSLDSDLRNLVTKNNEGAGYAKFNGPGTINVARIILKSRERASSVEPFFSISRSDKLYKLDGENININVDLNASDSIRIETEKVRAITERYTSIKLYGNTNEIENGIYFLLDQGKEINFPTFTPNSIRLRDFMYKEDGTIDSFSSIISGSLVINETGKKYELERGSDLVLDQLAGNLRITINRESLKVIFTGKVRTLGWGSSADNLTSDLRPTIAEWISNNETIALIWSSLLFVIGLIWTIWHSVFN